jgi:hypothetical protein
MLQTKPAHPAAHREAISLKIITVFAAGWFGFWVTSHLDPAAWLSGASSAALGNRL